MDLIQIMGAAWLSKSVSVAARLGIADVVAEIPLDVAEIARRTGSHSDSFARLIDVLVCFGIFQRGNDARIANTPTSDRLRSDHPLSMRHYCMLAGEEYYDGWGGLLHTVRTGEPAFTHVFGNNVYNHLDRHPATAATYDAAMEDLARPVAALLARDWADAFACAAHVVDIGGGSGTMVRHLLMQHPHLRATVLDREDVCARATDTIHPSLGNRLVFRPGDFFEDVPSGDLYLLKNVLHNWNAENCVRILCSVARGMQVQDGQPARLLVIEPLVEPADMSPRLLMNALFQIVICQEGTRERNLHEMAEMLDRAGLRLDRSVRLPSGHTVVEALLR